jgi:hypothetical protein
MDSCDTLKNILSANKLFSLIDVKRKFINSDNHKFHQYQENDTKLVYYEDKILTMSFFKLHQFKIILSKALCSINSKKYRYNIKILCLFIIYLLSDWLVFLVQCKKYSQKVL